MIDKPIAGSFRSHGRHAEASRRAAGVTRASTGAGRRGDDHRSACGHLGVRLPVRPAWTTAWEAHSLSVLTGGRFEMGIGTGRPGLSDHLRQLGLPTVPVNRRSEQVRAVVAALRELDGPDLHTRVVMAVGGPQAQRLAAEVADTVNFVMPQTEPRAVTAQRVRAFEQRLDGRDVEFALHVPVIGDAVAPFMASPVTDPVAVREADALAFLPGDPVAAAEEIHRRREETGFSYFVFGADVAGPLAPVVAELAGR